MLALVLVAIMPGASQSSDGPVIIDLMIDAQNFSSEDQALNSERTLEDITDLIM